MPISYEIDSDARLVRGRQYGVVVEDDLRSHVETLWSDPRFRADLDELHDLSEVMAFEVSSEYIRSLAKQVNCLFSKNASVRVAFVAPSDLLFGLTRMYGLLRADSQDEIRVFRKLADAKEWPSRA